MNMNDYLKCYKVKIHALSPIYIGSGEKIRKKEYIFMPWKKQVVIPDIKKMYEDICEKGLEKTFINYMMDNTSKCPSLQQWLEKFQLGEKDFERWKKYELDGGEAFLSRTARPKEIDAFIKNAYGMPYVPGSSIKGMIRTALIAYEIKNNPKKYANTKDLIWKNSNEKMKRNWCLRKEMTQLEKQVLYMLERDEKNAGNAVNDNLSGLHVGDSEPIDLEQLTLSQKIDYTLDYVEKELPLLRECIVPGTDIEFEISIDSKVCPYNMEDVIKALNSFQEICYQYFYSRFRRGTEEKNIVWLGGGCGFLSKTVVYPMFGKDAVKVVDNIYRNTLGASYGKHKHTKDLGLKLAPHVCKCTRYQGELYDMGMGRIEYREI